MRRWFKIGILLSFEKENLPSLDTLSLWAVIILITYALFRSVSCVDAYYIFPRALHADMINGNNLGPTSLMVHTGGWCDPFKSIPKLFDPRM